MSIEIRNLHKRFGRTVVFGGFAGTARDGVTLYVAAHAGNARGDRAVDLSPIAVEVLGREIGSTADEVDRFDHRTLNAGEQS